MRSISLFLSVLFFNFSYCQTPDSIQQTKSVAVSAFTNLKLYSGINAVLIPSNENKVVITCDDPESVIVTQKNNILRVRVSLSKLIELPVVYLEIYYKTPLEEIDLNQGSSLEIKETIAQTSIVLKVQEGAKLNGTFDLVKLTTNVGSGGQVAINGKAKNHLLNVNSGGSCEAEKFLTEQTTVRVTAGGMAYVNASALVEAKVNFNGTIRVYGSPTKLVSQKTLGGQIIEMD